MPDRPLLIFPSPSNIGRYKLTGRQATDFISPLKAAQIARLQPTLDNLEAALQGRRVTLQSDISGVEPEMVLVLETRGLVDNFFKAVKKIPELEWLGETERDFSADEFFHYTDINKQVRGKIFFILTNYHALRRLVRLWENYKYSNQFDHGTTKWRDVFALLHDIRPWGLQDRIFETGLLQDWNFRMEHQQGTIPFEIELWFRKTNAARANAVNNIQALLEQFDGEIISQTVIEEIAYHAILVRAPIKIFNDLNEQTDIEFFRASDIMFLRPVGQCAVKFTEADAIDHIEREQVPALLNPIVALFDGLPLQNHNLLENRLVIDDPDNYAQGYLAATRYHGTGMSSIIIYGDLTDNRPPLASKLYVRPILKPETTFRGSVELIPENILIVDQIHRAVRRLFENDGEIAAVAPTVRIINLSVGDPARIFDNSISAWAKLLDWLSFKYKVLFIVSAGNCADDLDYSGFNGQFNNLLANADDLKVESLRTIYNNNRHRKIIAPAESVNAITAGASDYDNLVFQPQNNSVLLFNSENYPSPLSRMGLGYRRSIKPEVIVPGGKTLFRQPPGQSALSFVNNFRPPGMKVAAPSANGVLDGTVFSNGTSNACAFLSHLAAKLYENFQESNLGNDLTGNLFSLAAKSLLVHCAAWNESAAENIQNAIGIQNINQRDLVARFIGYGHLSPHRIFECTDKRVTLLGYGALPAEHGHLYKLPIPNEISGSTLWRSLTATLAWFTPINPLHQAYRQSKLWFDFPNKALERILRVSRSFYDNDTVNRGTIQHEIFNGTNASAFLQNTELEIRVNCKEDAAGMAQHQEIPYVLAVTLEVDPNFGVDIYNAVELRIRPRIPVR